MSRFVNSELEGLTKNDFVEYHFELEQCYMAQLYSCKSDSESLYYYCKPYRGSRDWVETAYWLYYPSDEIVKPPFSLVR